MAEDLSIYGHDKATDPRYAPVNGRIPIGVIGYYACCETKEPPCDKVAFRLPDGSSTEFLLGELSRAYPRLLWWKGASVNFPSSGPRGVRLRRLQMEYPCTRFPDEPHQWWEWEWAPDRLAPVKRMAKAIGRRLCGIHKERSNA